MQVLKVQIALHRSNLATILSDYRKNFYLSEDGIVFCQPGKAHQSIVLTYKELGI